MSLKTLVKVFFCYYFKSLPPLAPLPIDTVSAKMAKVEQAQSNTFYSLSAFGSQYIICAVAKAYNLVCAWFEVFLFFLFLSVVFIFLTHYIFRI